MSIFVDALADYLVSGGIGQYYASGLTIDDTTVQVDFRRDTVAQVALVRETGGAAYPHATKELHTIQILVDGATISGAKAKAREIHDLLHETLMTRMAEHRVMWLRAATLPQAIPTIAPNLKERFQFSTNFQALLVVSDTGK